MNFTSWLENRGSNKPIWHECYFGGSFNPIHFGHIETALDAKSQLGTNIVLLPAGNPPHKQDLIQFQHRLAMCQIVANMYGFTVNAIEGNADNSTPTSRILRKLVPNLEKWLVPFLVGADSVNSMHTWVEPTTLADNVLWVVAPRANIPTNNSHFPNLHIIKLKGPEKDVSSTQIRNAFTNGEYEKLRQWIPERVEDYIVKHKLYGL